MIETEEQFKLFQQSNPITKKYLPLLPHYLLKDNPDTVPELLPCYQLSAQTLSVTPSHDPAFAYFYNEEEQLRKRLLYAHIKEGGSDLCLVIGTRLFQKNIIEVLDTYGFGYTPWNRYSAMHTDALGIYHGVIVDLRKKDLNDEQVLEAHEFIREVCNMNKVMRNTSVQSSVRISLAYAGCFFS